MQTTAAQSGEGKSAQVQLAALESLLEEARKLIQAQEREVESLRAAGQNTKRAEGLLDAYRESARIAAERKRELERELARRS